MPRLEVLSNDLAALPAALRDAGHDLRLFTSGWELLEALGDDPDACQLIVSHTLMPFPDGLSVATLVRAAGVTSSLLVLCGKISERMRKVAEGLGASLLEDPIGVENFLAAVHDALERKSQTPSQAHWPASLKLFGDRSTES